MGLSTSFLFTCEHGGNRVPEECRHLFHGAESVLASHRGYDPGALGLAEKLSRAFDAPLVGATTTRLLVDLNRTEGHPAVFSEFTRGLPEAERRSLLERHHRPHWARVQEHLLELLSRGRVIHVGVHSFTPVLGDQVRTAEVGLLYDPRRSPERNLCARWKPLLEARAPGMRVRRNYPYRGDSDGLTTALRRRHPEARYLGIELELNHGLLADRSRWEDLEGAVLGSLQGIEESAEALGSDAPSIG